MRTQDNELEIDPHICTCGPCKQFWKQQFPGTGNKLKSAPAGRSADTSLMYSITLTKEDHPAVLKLGDRVEVKGFYKGVVKYLGTLDDHLIAPKCFVGVHLDEQVNSTHNGVYKGKRYFHCPRGHGCFVKYCEVVKINPPEKRPPVVGNPMYPNYKDMLKRRKARAQKDQSMESWGPPFNRHVTVTVFDKNDIAALDQERMNLRRQKRSHSIKEEVSREDVQRWKHKFGGDARAEAMAQTLKRLHLAHNRAKLYEIEDEVSAVESHDRKPRQSISFGGTRRISTIR